MKIINLTLSYIKTKFLLLYHRQTLQTSNGCIIFWKAKIFTRGGGRIEIGMNTEIGRSPKGYHASMPFQTTLLVDTPSALIQIGNNCRINGAYIHAQSNIHIGNNCVVASGVNIIDSNGHETYSLNRTVGRDIPQPIHIDDNVWIGCNAIILKGSIIGKNSIVGAGSVVHGTFPANSLIIGNPAKLIKTLEI